MSTKRSHLLRSVPVIGSLLVSAAVSGQVGSTPEGTAQAYMEATRQRDWQAAASLMHPDALREMRDFVESLLQMPDGAQLGAVLFEGKTSEAIAALPDTEYFAAFLGMAMNEMGGMDDLLSSAQSDIVGTVMEGETAHLVVRISMSADDFSFSQMEVQSYRQYEGQWLALLQGDLSSMIAGFRAGWADPR